MRLWVTRFAALLGGVVAAPIAVEGLIAYIKGERYSMSRAGVIFGCLLVAGGMLTILRVLVQRLQQLLEVGLLVFGVTTSVAGLMLVTQVGPRTDAVGVFIACLGLLIAGFAGYLIYAVNTGADLAFAAPRMTGNHVDQEFDGAGHSVLLRRYPTFTASDEEVANACRRLSPADVHFIGYYVNGRCKFHVDVLENAELSRFFRGTDRESRRLVYERSGRQLSWIMTQLNVYTKKLNSGILIRTVLDVEQGALYYYWISRNAYLTGITMDQSKVLDADEELRRLANTLGVLPRGGPAQSPIAQVIGFDHS